MSDFLNVRLPDRTVFKVDLNLIEKAESLPWRQAVALAVWAASDSSRVSRVYFVMCDHYIKIGVAVDPAQRVRDLQTANPHKLELLFSIPGSTAIEQRFHAIFSDCRTRGEWFYLTEDLKHFLKLLLAMRYAPLFDCDKLDPELGFDPLF